jgi:hypothetical protein
MLRSTWQPALVLNAGYFYIFTNAFNCVNPENFKYRHNKLVCYYYVRHLFDSRSPGIVAKCRLFFLISNAFNCFSVVNPEKIKYRLNKLVRCYYVRH